MHAVFTYSGLVHSNLLQNAICFFDLLQVRHLGSGSFGDAKLMLYKPAGELVAVKFIERGYQVRRRIDALNSYALGHILAQEALISKPLSQRKIQQNLLGMWK